MKIPNYKELPYECPATVRHCLMHLDSAIEAANADDLPQVAHELAMMRLILKTIRKESSDE